jgi:hypothetical protein
VLRLTQLVGFDAGGTGTVTTGKVTASPGDYLLTGTVAEVRKATILRVVAAGSGSYVLVGGAANLNYARKAVVAGVGSYGLTGTAANVSRAAGSPPVTGLIGWWDAAVTASLTLSGSNVLAIADLSGAGTNLANSTGLSRATYNATGFNSRPSMMFNGSFVNSTAFPMGTGNTLTVFAAAQIETFSGSFARLFHYASPGNTDDNSAQSWCIARSPGTPQVRLFRNGTQSISTTMSYSTPRRIIGTVSSSGVITIYIDGVAATSATLGGNWATGGNFALGTDGSDSWGGAIAVSGVATGYSDATAVAALDTWLRNQVGL